MMSNMHRIAAFLATAVLLLPLQVGDAAAQDRGVEQRIQTMERDLRVMKRELEAAKKQAAAEDEALSKWHLAGYTSAIFTATDAGDIETTFGSLHFNPVLHFQYSDWILFEGELEFELEDDGTTHTALEYASIDILATDWATIVAGQFLSPVGQFQERLHPTWVNKLPDAPAGFGHGGAQPLSDLGVMVRGGIPISNMILSYSVAVGNGPRVGHHGTELEAFGTDDNDNKAVSGRIGILPIPHLEIGASFMTAKLKGEEAQSGPVTEGDYHLWGVDASFTKGAWDVRGEYLNSELGSFFGAASHNPPTTSLIPETDWEAWYVQVAYQFSGITEARFLRNLELVARYGEVDITGNDRFENEGRPEKRVSLGVNYLFAPPFMLKTAVSWRNFTKPGAGEDSTEFKAQLAYGF